MRFSLHKQPHLTPPSLESPTGSNSTFNLLYHHGDIVKKGHEVPGGGVNQLKAHAWVHNSMQSWEFQRM